jgi:hypothetical protein
VLTITVEGFDHETDGANLLTFSPQVGVEIGEPTVLALSGEPSMLRFSGTFEDHGDTILNQWDKLAKENDRPAIFDEQGLRGLARLPSCQNRRCPRSMKSGQRTRMRFCECRETEWQLLERCAT